jgi:tRNA U38,U39,U40 pseudouridine synthase TruA
MRCRRWNAQVKAGDKIERAHHRHVRSCRLEGGPAALAPGGPPALKVVIVGDSFMLHQIRCCGAVRCGYQGAACNPGHSQPGRQFG